MRRGGEGGGVGKAAEAGERRQLVGVLGQRLGLLVGDHLQAMLDGAQEAVGLCELVARGGGDPAALLQRCSAVERVAARAARGWRPPAISCWVCTKNSISRMPPRPTLMLWPATPIVPKPRKAWIWRFMAWMSAMAAKSRYLRQM